MIQKCVIICYSFNLAQCRANNLATTSTSATSLSMSWTCYDQNIDDEFEVNYQLQNLGQCEERGSRTNSPFDLRTTQWSAWNRQVSTSGNTHQHSATLSDLIPHSTYMVFLKTREPTGAPGGYYNYQYSSESRPDPTTSRTGE